MSKSKVLPPGAEEHAIKILERVWTLSRKRKAAVSKRENLFDERDSLDAKILEFKDSEAPEAATLAAKWRGVVKEIERLAVDIRYYGDEIDKAIDDGEQGKFDFLEDDVKPPASLYDKLRPKVHDEQKEAKPTPKDPRPVGVPNGTGTKRPLVPAAPEGVDEQLKASIQELEELSDADRVKLSKVDLLTVGDIAKVLDADGATGLQKLMSVGEGIAARIKKAVDVYRTKHRRAIAEAERTS